MYKFLVNQMALPLNKFLWKLRLPLKIKIFNWLVHKEVILTKDNLLKRRWKGDDRCCFCDNKETVQHLFFDCNSFLLDSFLELTTEREEQANLEVGVSSARNYGHGDFRQAWMVVF
ncbi:hypothetical protein U9M48_002773 [Paspalum notatum var. saurae]|uniref:Reverse transcriptase zinc-binding domain-containing protein n=1 Tax=Paspalum notatum var. saurae TaxID=547442 RepID=A0AAQ3PRE2_PASNO